MNNESFAEGFIYNVTVKVDAGIAAAWLTWLQTEYLPEVMKSGCFSAFRLVRLLEVDDSEGPTYAIQYHAASKADYNRFRTVHEAALQQRSYKKWGDGFIAFGSLMEVVQ